MLAEGEDSPLNDAVDDACTGGTLPVRCVRHCCVVEQLIPEFRRQTLTVQYSTNSDQRGVLYTYTFDPDAQSEG